MHGRCKVRAFNEKDKYEFALKIGDVVHLLIDDTIVHEIECPRDNCANIEEIARCINALVENGCVTVRIAKPLNDIPIEEIMDEMMEPNEQELDAFIESLTDADLEWADTIMREEN